MAASGSTTNSTWSFPATAPVEGEARFDGDDETTLLRKIVAVCGHLSALASHNTDLAGVVHLLADGVGSSVAVLDRGLEVLTCAGVNDADFVGKFRDHAGSSGLSTVLAAAARNLRALTIPTLTSDGESIIVAPVVVGDDIAGYLLTLSDHADGLSEDMRLLATEHAAVVCGVVLGREVVVAAAARRARQDLVEGLLVASDHDERDLDRWARHLGLDPAQEYYVMCVAAPDARSGSDPSPVESLIGRLAPAAVVAARTDEVVAIAPVTGNNTTPREQAEELARACPRSTRQRLHVSGIGIGNRCASVAEIPRSYAEARCALSAGQRMGESDTVTAFADLGIHRLLLRVPNASDLRSFADEVLGPLVDEENSHDVQYLATLSVYFQENGSPRRTGQRLHLHPNTVSYRIRRIEQITGLALHVHRDRLMAEVAVEILDGLGSRA